MHICRRYGFVQKRQKITNVDLGIAAYHFEAATGKAVEIKGGTGR